MQCRVANVPDPARFNSYHVLNAEWPSLYEAPGEPAEMVVCYHSSTCSLRHLSREATRANARMFIECHLYVTKPRVQLRDGGDLVQRMESHNGHN